MVTEMLTVSQDALGSLERRVQGVEAHLHVGLTRLDQRLREHEGELRRWAEQSTAEGSREAANGDRQERLTGPAEGADDSRMRVGRRAADEGACEWPTGVTDRRADGRDGLHKWARDDVCMVGCLWPSQPS